MTAFGITVFPFSWGLGVWSKPHKTLLAIGPIRFVVHYTTKHWRET